MMRLMPVGSWDAISPQVDWERIDRSTDAEIERQEIADLVEDALELEAGSLTALAARIDVSPTSVSHCLPRCSRPAQPGAADRRRLLGPRWAHGATAVASS